MYASRVKSVLNDFFQVLSMRWNEVKEEASMIGSKLEEQNDNISDAVIKLEKKWHAEKPIDIWASEWTDKEVVASISSMVGDEDGYRARKSNDSHLCHGLFVVYSI